MSTQSSSAEQPISNRHRAVEFVYWIGAVTLIITLVGAVIAALGGDLLVRLKYFLFIVGFLMFGIGSFGIQPKSPRLQMREKSSGRFRMPVAKLFSFNMDGDSELWFERLIQRLPPLRDRPMSIGQRVSRNTKVFATSLAVLGLSFALEMVLGVTA